MFRCRRLLEHFYETGGWPCCAESFAQVGYTITTREEGQHCICDVASVPLYTRPACSRKNQNRKATPGQILLIRKVLIGGDQNVEIAFCRSKQFTVIELGPPHLIRGRHVVAGKMVAQRCRRALVEQYPHAPSPELRPV